MHTDNLFEFPESLEEFRDFFMPTDQPWLWVSQIRVALAKVLANCRPALPDVPAGLHVEGPVYLHPSVKLPPYGSVQGPAWIGPNSELRPGVFIRGNVITGAGCVLGNSSECKNCLLMNGVQVPHFSYVGDSILGNQAHLGAGAILSNFRMDGGNIGVRDAVGEKIDTGMRKLGAILGDRAQLGCNAVAQPGSILGKEAVVLTGVVHKGYLAKGHWRVE